MIDRFPLVTVLVPAQDEEADIGRCLECIAAQRYPVNRLEVIVVDGGSTDGTRAAAAAALRPYGFASTTMVENSSGSTPSNLNAGLRRAAGEIVCRVDARTLIEPHYVRTCVDVLLDRPDVAVVGGAQVAVARNDGAKAIGIARALNNRFSMGGSRYRSATTSGPSDTVYLGAFRADDLRSVGAWDERFPTNQDFDLNRRMSKRGAVWFDASLRSGYVPRATLAALWSQYLRFGQSKVRYWRLTGDRPLPRQRALLAFPLVAAPFAIASRRPKARRIVAAGVVAGSLAIEHRGASSQPPASPVARCLSVVAMGVIAAAWTSGAWSEAIRPSVPIKKRAQLVDQ